MVHAHCRSTSSILLLITGSICCCSAVICCRVASGIPSCTASVTGSEVWAGLLPQRLRFRAAAGASELPAASSVLAPHLLRRLPSADSGAAAASANSGTGGEASVMRELFGSAVGVIRPQPAVENCEFCRFRFVMVTEPTRERASVSVRAGWRRRLSAAARRGGGRAGRVGRRCSWEPTCEIRGGRQVNTRIQSRIQG